MTIRDCPSRPPHSLSIHCTHENRNTYHIAATAAAHKRPGIVTVFAWSRSLKKTMVHYIDKPALLYATTYVLQLVVIHTSEAEQDALFGNSARVGGLKIGGHWSVYCL